MNWYDSKVMNAIDNDLTDILLKSILCKDETITKTWDISLGYVKSFQTHHSSRFCSKRINIKKQVNREML